MRPCPRDSAARRCSAPQQAQRSGQNRNRDRRHAGDSHSNTVTVEDYTIRSCGSPSRSLLAELEEAPLIPLSALLLSDASPREIVRRLRLNVAIRMLLDAIAESEATASW